MTRRPGIKRVGQSGNQPEYHTGYRVVALTGFCLPMIMFSEVFKTLPIGPITLIALFAVTARAAWSGRTDALP